MIITNIADGQVTDQKLVEFNFREISYSIKGSTGEISGAVPAESYMNVDATKAGEPPYTVTLGYVNQSYQAEPVSVGTDDSLCMFWMAFPCGPNGPKTFVYEVA